jgi:VIT1/CCC1 family predicted Fe2+/Mn2+ transporter
MGQEEQALFAERDRIARLERIRQLVFGSMDGLLVPLGVVSGVAAGTGSTRAVIVAGIAEAFAGALSMGAGEFIAGRSEAQVQLAEVKKELEEIRASPRFELAEMARLFEHEQVSPEDAKLLARTLARYPHAYAKTMVEKELGIPFEPETANIPEALTMGASYLIAAVIPLVAYFFLPIQAAFAASLVLTAVALLAVGLIKGRLARLNPVRSVLEVVLVGAVSGLGGYLLGNYLPGLFAY